MKKQHRKDRAELEKRENQDRAELQKQRRNLQRIKEKVAKMKTTWPQKLREEEDHEIEELDAKRFHRIEKLDKDALTDNEDDQDNAANADNQDLGLRSGLESPGLDRPGRLPHQQGLNKSIDRASKQVGHGRRNSERAASANGWRGSGQADTTHAQICL